MYCILIVAVILLGLAEGQDHYPPVAYGEACISQGFSSSHTAVDIASYGKKRVNLHAIWDGTVTSVCNGAGDFDKSRCGDCGNSVDIRHNTVSLRYCHLTANTLTVSPGQRVSRAQKIGVMGTSGLSTGVHLHVIVTELNNGQRRDIRTRLGLNGWRSC
ncbi:hypothetical protein I4U23_016331 [Adineta vaga]|nr:hypothetical protein I4U23_016331 [Adineta vaga]